jgi:Concanavalin A-like lectin/glucanases superfamily
MIAMSNTRRILATLALAAASGINPSCAFAAELDRYYRMGDDPLEATTNGAPIVNGGAVNVATRDSQGVAGQAQLIHLSAVNSPTYRTITGRPDGVGGFGIEFNAAQQEYLRGPNLGIPSASVSHTHPDATLNYDQISNRGLQFWVRPTSSAAQSLVMDTNQHGVRIDSSGKFSMRYANVDYASAITAVPNTWYHVEVVRPAGSANGSRMFIDGIAAAAVAGGYDGGDSSELVVGSNTAGSSTSFSGGTAEFFSGIVDDLKLFVIGQAPLYVDPDGGPNRPAHDYGGFNFATDNDFAAAELSGVSGDVTNDGLFNQLDKTAFIAGWLDRKLINNIQIGDLSTHSQGDLNFDGITDIHDLLVFQNALSGAGMAAITAVELQGAVPEPSSALLGLLTAAGLTSFSRFRERTRR